jgi:alanine-alpha-ketoisovalerate/valine-pyruvate aminotransferase
MLKAVLGYQTKVTENLTVKNGSRRINFYARQRFAGTVDD